MFFVGEFNSVNSSSFWFGTIIDSDTVYSTLGIDLVNDQNYFSYIESSEYVNISMLNSSYCTRFSLNMTSYYFAYYADFVKCDGNETAYFLCRKVPHDCSEFKNGSSATPGTGMRKKRQIYNEASLDKVFVPSEKLKYEQIAKRSQQSATENFKKMNLEKSYKSLFEILW